MNITACCTAKIPGTSRRCGKAANRVVARAHSGLIPSPTQVRCEEHLHREIDKQVRAMLHNPDTLLLAVLDPGTGQIIAIIKRRREPSLRLVQ